MNKENPTIKTEKKPEEIKTPDVAESPEKLRQEITEKSKEEVNSFKQESQEELARFKDVDDKDREELQGLDQKVDVAKKDLLAEIEDKEKFPTKEQEEAFKKGREKVLNLKAEGNDKSPEYWNLYSHLTEGIGNDIQWRNASDINTEKVNKMLASKFPEKDQLVIRTCPKCGREYTGTSTSYCNVCGSELKLKQLDNESTMEEKVVKRSRLLTRKEASKSFLKEERKKLAQEILEERKAQRERLSILNINIENTIADSENTDGQREDEQYGRFTEMQSNEANKLAERLKSPIDLNEQDAKDEQENIAKLIITSEDVALLKEKIKQHYAKADEIAKEQFENIQKSVEQTALRNGVFFVHTIQEWERNRHNELSNVSKSATYEDDADILLSLEPSISASSIFSGCSEEGKISGLWSNTGGFLIGSGDIRYASRNDMDSKSTGIKERAVEDIFKKPTVEDIDNVAKKRGETEHDRIKGEAGTNYNEFIIDNPKVFGYFQPVGVNIFEKDKYWAVDNETSYESGELERIRERLKKAEIDPELYIADDETAEVYVKKLNEFNQKIERYKNRFEQMKSRGNLLYIMTPEKDLFEYLGVNDDGSVNTGRRLTPEDVATGRAGLSVEKRKEIGKNIVEKKIFKKQEIIEEAEKILKNL